MNDDLDHMKRIINTCTNNKKKPNNNKKNKTLGSTLYCRFEDIHA